MDNTYSGPKYENASVVVEATKSKRDGAVAFKKYGVIAIVFAIIYTFCLYKNHSGITYPIYMAATLVCLKLMRAKDGLSLLADVNGKKGLGIFYVVSLMLLSVHRCMTTSDALLGLESLAIFLLLFSFIVYLYVDTTSFDIAAWLGGILLTLLKPIEHLPRPISDFMAYSKSKDKNVDDEKKKTIYAVLIGIVIAIPLLMFVIVMLSSADVVFQRVLSDFFENIHLPDNIGDIFGIIGMTIIAFWFAYIIPSSLVEKELKVNPVMQGDTNPVIAITFTSLVGLVYLLFCGIQVMYLFTRSMTIPDGYTYTEYAHEGFYQLLTICILNLLMVSVCQRMFKESKALRIILTVIAACTYIMIASSAMRMIIYIKAYHLTFLRLFVLWFLAVLCLWLAFLIVSMYVKSFSVFRACMVTITVAFLVFVYANPDYQIAKYDILATEDKIDEWNSVEDYVLKTLSTDAAPAMKEDKNMLHLFDIYITLRDKYDNKNYSGIRKFNFSYYRAQKIFENK